MGFVDIKLHGDGSCGRPVYKVSWPYTLLSANYRLLHMFVTVTFFLMLYICSGVAMVMVVV